MSTHHLEIEHCLDTLLDISIEDRDSWISAHPRLTERTRQQLRNILQQLHQAGPLDQGIPFELINDDDLTSSTNMKSPWSAGDQLGVYQLEYLLGEGGMGSVWRAKRNDGQTEQLVAIKCLRSPLATHRERARFFQEQKVLAQLQHPYITQLYDVGLSKQGMPYIVLEWVRDGTSVLAYCNQCHMGVRERLTLFLKICDAVHYAHQNLIVHRDLKPGNILVDCYGHPKLLDFGIAKKFDASVEPLTQTGALLFTPEYAAPEQFHGERITTRTDVYALGVVLYELLAGVRPRSSERLNTQLGDEMQPPSEAFRQWQKKGKASSAVTREMLATQRKLTPSKLTRILRGDLDAILMHALQKIPERRYASVVEFSDDLNRYLNQKPIAAHKISRWYRVRKFIQRNFSAVLITALLSAALLASGLYGIYQTLQAQSRAQEAQKQTQIAREKAIHAQNKSNQAGQQLHRANSIKKFFADVISNAEQNASRDPFVKTSLLSEAARQIDIDFRGAPEVQLELYLFLQEALTSQKQNPLREQLIQKAEQLTDKKISAQYPLWLATRRARSQWFADHGRLEKAMLYLQDSIEMHERYHPKSNEELGLAYQTLGDFYLRLNQAQKAVKTLRKAASQFRSILSSQDPRQFFIDMDLAAAYIQNGQAQEAEKLIRVFSPQIEQRFGSKHIYYAQALRVHSQWLMAVGQKQLAVQHALRHCHLMDQIYGPGHVKTADSYAWFSTLLLRQ